jgi:GTP-binding protein
MKILSAEYVISAPSIKEAPDWSLPEIAMVGRSNVGKSSLINRLTGRKKLAQTSNTPGKTRLMNFYNINNTLSLVDLPGYGYAKVSKTMQANWQKHFQIYLSKRKNLTLVIQLIDARHGPQALDEQMLSWLESHNLPVILVLTKVDKISRNDLGKQVALTAKELGLSPDQVFTFSAETGWGKDALWSFLGDYLKHVKDNPAE